MKKQNDLSAFGYQQQLHRSLTFWQLTAFGLNYMIPIAPAIAFGFILSASGGTVILPYLLAGLMMLTTAMSYGILLKKFPIAGSLYSYISRGLNPYIGFLAGWVFLLDYLLLPTVASMSVAAYIHMALPTIPYWICLLFFVSSTGLFNLFGVDLMARMGLWILVIGEIVIFVGFGIWSYAVSVLGIGVGHLLSLEPFHFHNLSTLASATAVAILSYLGFDAITTLSEEANNPTRDIPRAIFYAVIMGGLTMCMTGYLGMLVIPNWRELAHDPAWISTILFYVAKITGGMWFVLFYISGFILAMALFNVVATAAAARLLFGMGRDKVLPEKIFGAINTRWKTPHWNIMTITMMQFVIGILFSMEKIFELVSYGALCGFALLNFSVIWIYYVSKKGFDSSSNPNIYLRLLKYFVAPTIGIIVMTWVFINLRPITLILGSIWLLIGIVYGRYRSRDHHEPPIFHL